MNIPFVMKRCSKCGEWKVASSINFYRHKNGKHGLQNYCKKCCAEHGKQHYKANKERINIQHKQYRENNKEKEIERHKQYYEANRDKIVEKRKQRYEANREKELERHKQYYENNRDKILVRHKRYHEANKDKIAKYGKKYREVNKEKIAEKNKRYYEDNKDKMVEQHKQYREANREKILEYQKQYYENNKDKVTEYHKQWYQDNKERIAEQHKQWYQSPQGQVSIFNSQQRRRIKEEQQGTGITKDQWLEMMQYFDWKCAYSGERLTNKTRSTDHIVPISTGGDNMIWNMVPMTRSLNSSKHANNMEEWYREQDCYDPKRLQKIYEWQEYAYNKYGKDSEYFNTNDIQIKLL